MPTEPMEAVEVIRCQSEPDIICATLAAALADWLGLTTRRTSASAR